MTQQAFECTLLITHIEAPTFEAKLSVALVGAVIGRGYIAHNVVCTRRHLKLILDITSQ